MNVVVLLRTPIVLVFRQYGGGNDEKILHVRAAATIRFHRQACGCQALLIHQHVADTETSTSSGVPFPPRHANSRIQFPLSLQVREHILSPGHTVQIRALLCLALTQCPALPT